MQPLPESECRRAQAPRRCGDRIDRGQHAATAEARDEAVDRHLFHTGRPPREEHAARHHDEAAEDRSTPADAVGDVAERDRPQGHADELHREHDAERTAIDAPFFRNAGRGEADREHIEAVERIEQDG